MPDTADTVTVLPQLQSSPVSASKLYLYAAIVLSLLAVAARLIVLRLTHSTTEDYFITLRYAENIARGHGFVYNSGEHVLGTTTPLYTLLLALAEWVHLDATFVGKAANILAESVTVFLIARLLARLGKPRTGLLAALLYATASTSVNFSIGGMETGLVTLASLSAICAYQFKLMRPFLVSAAILFLLRIDGLLLSALLLAGWLYRERAAIPDFLKDLVRKSPPFWMLVIPWLVFSYLYFGSVIPVSMLAKVHVYTRLFPQPLPNLPVVKLQFLGGLAQKMIFVAFLIGLSTIRIYRAMAVPAVWMSVYYATLLISKVIAFGWYFMPPLPVYYLFVALGVNQLIHWLKPLKSQTERFSPQLSLAGLALLSLPLLVHLRSVAADISTAQRTEDVVRLPIGLWLRDNASPNEKLLLEPIGYIGYYSQLPVLDMIGLVSPEVLPSYNREVANPLFSIVENFKPALLLLRPSEVARVRAGEAATGRKLLDGEYRLVKSFEDLDRHEITFQVYRRK